MVNRKREKTIVDTSLIHVDLEAYLVSRHIATSHRPTIWAPVGRFGSTWRQVSRRTPKRPLQAHVKNLNGHFILLAHGHGRLGLFLRVFSLHSPQEPQWWWSSAWSETPRFTRSVRTAAGQHRSRIVWGTWWSCEGCAGEGATQPTSTYTSYMLMIDDVLSEESQNRSACTCRILAERFRGKSSMF